MFGRVVAKSFMTVVFISLFTPSSAYCGWILKDRDGGQTFISDGKIKHAEDAVDNSFLTIDYNKGRVTLADGERQLYASGALEEYCDIVRRMMEAFGQVESAFGAGQENAAPKVKITSEGQDKIAGMQAMKYKVMVDDELYEEIWLTEDSALLREIAEIDHHIKFMGCFEDSNDPVESSPDYRELARKGWELRSISYDFGEKEYNSDTETIRQENIDESVFLPPSSFKQVQLEELFVMGSE